MYARCPEGKLPIGGGAEALTYVFGGGFGQFGGAHIVASKPTAGRS